MAAFGNQQLYATGTNSYFQTLTSNTSFITGTTPISVSALRAKPKGRPLPIPPQEGMWIAQDMIGAQKRKIIEVVCGSHVVCKGKRHSIIKWANLHRYLEVEPEWDSTEYWQQKAKFSGNNP